MANTYGEWLRQQREAAGLTQQELADAAIMTRSHIAHIEAGRRIPSRDDARRLDKALGTGDVLTKFLPGDESAIADHFAAASVLERQAVAVREFASTLVPGILQTEEYTRAVLDTAYPPWSKEECDRLVVARRARAQILSTPTTPMFWALLDEAVLRRPVGGPAVMASQILHIIRLVEAKRVRVHIIPLGLGAHPLMQGMLTLMWFEDQPPAAYTEGVRTGKLHDDPALIAGMMGAYDLALGDALPLKESLALMRAAAKGYGHHD